MIDLAAATEVIKLLTSSVNFVDRIYDSWKERSGSRAISATPDDHGEKIESAGNDEELIHTLDGKTSQRITAEDLKKKLSGEDVEFLEALEQRMKINVKKWNSIVSNMGLEIDRENIATYEMKLSRLKKDIAKDLRDILSFVERLGFTLQDHYQAARMIAGQPD